MFFLADICTNPDFLRVIYFGKKILNVGFIIMPIGLIIMLIIDVFKMMTASDEKNDKKSMKTIVTRIIFAVLLFFVPTIVSAVMNLVDNGDSYVSCITNANMETINKLDKEKPSTGNNSTGTGNSNGTGNTTGNDGSSSGNNGVGRDENDTPQSNGFINYGTGTENDYFAPVQNVSYTKGNFSGTSTCKNGNVSHDLKGVKEGTPIYAGMDGEALFYQTYCSTTKQLHGYGNLVKLTGKDGTYILYAHLERFPDNVIKQSNTNIVTASCPKKGSTPPCPTNSCSGNNVKNEIITLSVKKGDLIGYLGNTGNSTGAHLHVEIHPKGAQNNCVIDPWKAFGMK